MKKKHKIENFCPLAEHYTKCPRWRKTCDAINCEAQFTWQEIEAIKRARNEANHKR